MDRFFIFKIQMVKMGSELCFLLVKSFDRKLPVYLKNRKLRTLSIRFCYWYRRKKKISSSSVTWYGIILIFVSNSDGIQLHCNVPESEPQNISEN
jgi:hypothetical protein